MPGRSSVYRPAAERACPIRQIQTGRGGRNIGDSRTQNAETPVQFRHSRAGATGVSVRSLGKRASWACPRNTLECGRSGRRAQTPAPTTPCFEWTRPKRPPLLSRSVGFLSGSLVFYLPCPLGIGGSGRGRLGVPSAPTFRVRPWTRQPPPGWLPVSPIIGSR